MDCLSGGTDTSISNAERRSRLYDKMARDLDEHGATFLKQGETSQSLSLSDLFTLKDGSVMPILKVKCEQSKSDSILWFFLSFLSCQ